MENRRRRHSDGCTAMAVESEKRLLVILEERHGGEGGYTMYKLDLNRHFPRSNSAIHVRRRPSDFSLSRCNSQRKKEKEKKLCSISKNRRRPLTLGRFARHLRFRGQQLQPLFSKPMEVNRRWNHQCPSGMGIAVLGSKIYLFGGYFMTESPLPRAMYCIDASSDSPEMVKMSCKLNSGKYNPKVCTIGGKIYALPLSFSRGRLFECFDPHSNSWTVLPSPTEGYVMESKFETLPRRALFLKDGFQVRSHVVVGSNLVISFESGGVFTFDTTQPDRGWRRIYLILCNIDPPRVLNFIPLDFASSFPIRDDLIFCSPRSDVYNSDYELDNFLEANVKIDIADSYVCSFDDIAALSNPECEFVKVSISSVTGILESKYKIKMDDTPDNLYFVKSSRTIGDGMVMLAKEGDHYYSFDIFQVRRALNSDHYEAPNISSVLFRSRSYVGSVNIYNSFVIKG